MSTLFQSKWLPKLSGLGYEILHKKGKENIADDALSRMQVSELLQINLSQLDIEANGGFSTTESSITTLIRVVHESQH